MRAPHSSSGNTRALLRPREGGIDPLLKLDGSFAAPRPARWPRGLLMRGITIGYEQIDRARMVTPALLRLRELGFRDRPVGSACPAPTGSGFRDRPQVDRPRRSAIARVRA